jgi:cobalt-zinc-cadmium efflux system protein
MTAPRNHAHGMKRRTLRTAFLLTLVILAVEAAGALLSHSLALLADAGHTLTDVAALGLAWFAAARAERPANARKTFGYHRTGILAAQVNAVTLLLLVGAIVFDAIQRLQHPEPVAPWLMLVAAAVGMALNLYIGLGLRRTGGENLNTRAAMLHVFGDVGASMAVLGGGVIILVTGWYGADPLMSLCVAALIAWGAWRILRASVNILMEATPRGLNVAQLVRDMVAVPGVCDVHDLHIWSIAGGMHALSAHVQITERPVSACAALVETLNTVLKDRYRIAHTTMQFECAGCESHDLYCAWPSDEGTETRHAHHRDQSGDTLDGKAAETLSERW